MVDSCLRPKTLPTQIELFLAAGKKYKCILDFTACNKRVISVLVPNKNLASPYLPFSLPCILVMFILHDNKRTA